MSESSNKVKGFFLYFSQWPAIKTLSVEQKAMLLEACFCKFAGEEYEIADPVVQMAFLFIEQGFKSDAAKYAETCARNKANRNSKKSCVVTTGNEKDDDEEIDHQSPVVTTGHESSQNSEVVTTGTNRIELNRIEENKNIINPPLTPQGGKSGGKREPTGNTKAELQAQIAAYTDYPELRDALEAYREMRERIRKPLTAYALKLALKHLDEMAEHIPTKIAIVNQSVLNSWQDIYPLKGNAATQQQSRARPGEFNMERQTAIFNEVLNKLEEEDAAR